MTQTGPEKRASPGSLLELLGKRLSSPRVAKPVCLELLEAIIATQSLGEKLQVGEALTEESIAEK